MNQIVHAVVAVALLAGYVTLSALGEDGNALLACLIAYLGGAGVQAKTALK